MNGPDAPKSFFSTIPWEKLVIWGLFWFAVWALRHFFAIIFATFILTYIMRSIVIRAARTIRPGREVLWLERVLAVACFALLLLVLYGLGAFLGPRLVSQGEALLARVTRLEPKDDFNDLLGKTLGSYLFDREYGGPDDPRYRRAFRAFQEGGLRVQAYKDFPRLEASIEGPFDAAIVSEEAERIRQEIGTRGPLDQEFREWFLSERVGALYQKNPRKYVQEWEERYRAFAEFVEGTPPLPELRKDPGFESKRDQQIREQILEAAYENEATREPYLREWQELHQKLLRDALADKGASAYRERFLEHYAERRRKEPGKLPYSGEQYLELEAAYATGEEAFSAVLRSLSSGTEAERLAGARHEFEVSTQRTLVTEWLAGPVAATLKEILADYAEAAVKPVATGLRESIGLLVTIPVQGALSLMLSFFITFDIPRLKRAVAKLASSRVSRLYLEIAPGLVNLGRLMGRAFEAQGVIAVLNTLLTFFALSMLGITNALFLGAIVFVCSFVPVLGVVFSSIPIAAMALVQPGGNLWLALKAVAAIIVVHFIETSFLNPKIIGDMLHLHPVMVLGVLALGEHYFGVWGLLLGVPVTVYVIRFVILQEGIPGLIAPATPQELSAGAQGKP